MAEAKRDAEWDQTASIIVHLRKCFGDKDAKFEQYHPRTAAAVLARRNQELIQKFNQPKNRSN